MTSARYVYWQDGAMRLGDIVEYPEYQTQGAFHEDLREHLKYLFEDLNSGVIPGIRRVAELQIA